MKARANQALRLGFGSGLRRAKARFCTRDTRAWRWLGAGQRCLRAHELQGGRLKLILKALSSSGGEF